MTFIDIMHAMDDCMSLFDYVLPFIYDLFIHSISVCQGRYDAALISAWEKWDEEHGSENDHPKEFPEKQVYFISLIPLAIQTLYIQLHQAHRTTYNLFAKTSYF